MLSKFGLLIDLRVFFSTKKSSVLVTEILFNPLDVLFTTVFVTKFELDVTCSLETFVDSDYCKGKTRFVLT
jgi:hypothetical protein